MAFFVVLFAFVAGCVMSNSAAEKVGNLRVMSYNIHHGEGTDKKVDLARIARLITENKVDLVALQEVDKNTERTGKIDMPSELARLTGMKQAFGANLQLQGGEYGNLVLSRFPIESVTNHPLPKIVEGEQRGLLQTTIKVGSRVITFCNVHLDHRKPDADRLAGVAKIRELLGQSQGAVIIAGDFNAGPESATYAEMKKWAADGWSASGTDLGFTIPSEAPESRIDYIWHSRGLKAKKGKVVPSDASDHLPVIIDFELR